MGYTNIREKMKSWHPHTKKLNYCSSVKKYEHNNNFGKCCSPGLNLFKGKDTSYLPRIKINLSDRLLIIYDIFEAKSTFT